ncbi:MAG: GYD domain-containing protein [Planctomycetota bacterium]|jgi:uncharacterized protein with GYD domain
MTRYVMLLNFTDKGLANIKDSPARSEAFKAAATKAGAMVESIYWTLGPYDLVVVLSASDESTAAALALDLGKLGNVRTTMLRAFDNSEFTNIVNKVS